MPVRPLNSFVLKWPNRKRIEHALCRWREKVLEQRADIRRIGFFGSYARGDWGVGSDLDLIVIVESSECLLITRAVGWETGDFPVPVDLQVYTEAEWRALDQQNRFMRTLNN